MDEISAARPGAAIEVLDTVVQFTTSEAIGHSIIRRSASGQSGYVCACNVHMLMEARRNPSLRDALRDATVVVPDGMPLVWLARQAGFAHAERVAGPDLFSELCTLAANARVRVGLLGGVAEDGDRLLGAIRDTWPALDVVFAECPWYENTRVLNDSECRSRIMAAGVQLLLVGLGCPKQEIWMHANAPELNCTAVGLGAAFDFVTGRQPRAPKMMQRSGLEWLYRAWSEPQRLGPRYAVTNLRFAGCVIGRFMSSGRVARIVELGSELPS